MKTCKICNTTKELSCFYVVNKTTKQRCARCSDCYLQIQNNKRNENIEEYNKNSLAYAKKWQQNNKGKVSFLARQYKLSKTKQTPNWLSEEQIKEILVEYELSAWCTEVTGIKYQVDHVVPLRGKQVCGLHVPWNLQVIPAIDNIKKSNKFVV